jgi:hypothetical protein
VLLGCLSLLLLADQAAAQSARRLGPTDDSGPRPLVVDVQRDVPAAPAPAAATAGSQSPSDRQRLEQRQHVLQAKLLYAQQQLDRVRQYNLHARPGTMSFENSAVLPPSPTLGPVRTSDPVQLYEPRSSLSHVLAAAEQNREAAQLELQVVENQLKSANSPEGGQATAPLQQAGPDQPAATNEPVSPQRIRQVEQELRLAEFRYRSAQARLEKLQGLGRLTYSQFHSNLNDKLRLEVLQTRLERDRLQSLQQQILPRQRPFHSESGN